MKRKNVVILGSTGTIGINTLRVIEWFPEHFRVVGLSAYNNVGLLAEQIRRWKPTQVAVEATKIAALKKSVSPQRVTIHDAATGLEQLVSLKEVDIVVIGMSGSAALKPFLAAVMHGKRVAPANKEALVIAGDMLMAAARRHGAEVIPIDSEQSAIFQCLQGCGDNAIKQIYLTASGGPLLNVPAKKWDSLSVAQILKHPRWKMGRRITVDSATLMNKGFEVIEATHLFGVSVDQIEVVVHPEAIVHSMVSFADHSIIAQLSVTDMRLPIQYALTYPQRLATKLRQLDFCSLGNLTFLKPDTKKFPSLALALYVAKQGGTVPAVLNAADEEAVTAFLAGAIRLSDIYRVVEKIVMKHKNTAHVTVSAIDAADRWAREETRRYLDV